MDSLKDIVKNTTAKLTHFCNSKGYFKICTEEHTYQLEINLLTEEWKDVYVYPEYKSITLMRWIRKGIENNDETLIMIK